MTIRKKFFVLGLLLCLGFGAIFLVHSRLQESVESELALMAKNHSHLRNAEKIVWLDEVLTQSTRNYIFTQDIYWKERYDEYGAQLDDIIKFEKEQTENPEDRKLFETQDTANLKLVEMELECHQLVFDGDLVSAQAIIDSDEYLRWKGIYGQTISDYLEKTDRRNEVGEAEIRENIREANFQFLVVMFSILAVVTVFGLGIGRSILRSLDELRFAVDRVTEGDFSYRINRMAEDEIGEVGAAFNNMSDQVQQLIDEVRRANHAKDQFLANMSHEIRTPLNGIVGAVQLLEDTELNSFQKDMFRTMSSSSESLLSIVNEVLDLSKINAGKMEIEEADFKLCSLIEEKINQMKPSAMRKGLRLELRQEEAAEFFVKGDQVRLGQILSNLLSNAVKFTEEGSISVSLSVKEISGNYDVEIQVTDTGIGIIAADIEKISKPFTQADASTTRRFGGTGLGLTISQELAALMGGGIFIESEYKVGSVFTLKVPLKKASEIAPERPVIDEPNVSSKKPLLLVEDNEINIKVAVHMLNKLGLKSSVARNGVEALKTVEDRGAGAFGLILMDLQMPVMGGIAATMALLKKYGDQTPPIVALTANMSTEDRKGCLEVGVSELLTKPVRLKELQGVVSKYLEGQES